MTPQELAMSVNGILGYGDLNWMGNYSYEFKKTQFSIFFHKESQAMKALPMLKEHGHARILKTPSWVNSYFKYSVLIITN